MSTLTKEKAWGIFRADKLQQPEGKATLDNMTGPEFEAYEAFAEEFDMELAKIGVEAQNEAATIMEKNPELDYLQVKPMYLWTVADYTNVITPFAHSRFERLHLSAMFRVQNAELLLELVKP